MTTVSAFPGEPTFTLGEFGEAPLVTPKINDKTVVEAKGQTSKGWYILAIVIGSVVFVGAGGFGTVGLLKSYGLITLNQSFEWLSVAIGFVGNTPHFLSLWATAAGGVVVGGGLIALGAYKTHAAAPENDETEALKPKNEPISSFSEGNLAKFGVKKEEFSTLQPNTFSLERRGESRKGVFIPSECPKPNFIVRRDKEGKLQSSDEVNQKEARTLLQSLWNQDFEPANPNTALLLFFDTECEDVEISPTMRQEYDKKLKPNSYQVVPVKDADNPDAIQNYIVLKLQRKEDTLLLFSAVVDMDLTNAIKHFIGLNFTEVRILN